MPTYEGQSSNALGLYTPRLKSYNPTTVDLPNLVQVDARYNLAQTWSELYRLIEDHYAGPRHLVKANGLSLAVGEQVYLDTSRLAPTFELNYSGTLTAGTSISVTATNTFEVGQIVSILASGFTQYARIDAASASAFTLSYLAWDVENPTIETVPAFEVSKAVATGNKPANWVVVETIASGSYGYVSQFADLSYDTSSFSVESLLYLDPTTAGAITDTPPTSANTFQQVIGVALDSNSNGKVRFFTGLNRIRKIGTDFIQSGAITATLIGGNETGGVIFGGLSGEFAQDTDKIFWDDTNKILVLGDDAALFSSSDLEIKNDGASRLRVQSYGVSGSIQPAIQMLSAGGTIDLPSNVQNGALVGQFGIFSRDDVGSWLTSFAISCVAASNAASGNLSTNVDFYLHSGASSSIVYRQLSTHVHQFKTALNLIRLDGSYPYTGNDTYLVVDESTIANYAAVSDTDGKDCYIRTQGGGTHVSNNPRGADIVFQFGTGNGTGRTGRMEVQGTLKPDIVSIDQFLRLPEVSELTISSGAVTVIGSHHSIDTEADAGTDDLDTISGGEEGDILILKQEEITRVPTVKHNVGNILLDASTDFALDTPFDRLVLQKHEGLWVEISRTNVGTPTVKGAFSGNVPLPTMSASGSVVV